MSVNFGSASKPVYALKYKYLSNGTEVEKDIKQLKLGNVTVWAKPYNLTLTQGGGVSSVTIKRTSTAEPSAKTGTIYAGTRRIFHGDVLTVSATASDGYKLNPYTQNYTVSGNISVTVTATSSMPQLDEPIVFGHTWEGSDVVRFNIINSTNNPTVTCYIEVYEGNTLYGTASAKVTPTSQLIPYTTITVNMDSSFGEDYESGLVANIVFTANGYKDSEIDYSLA